MSKEGNDKKSYSAEDLLRYHEGQMSDREMHALEKAAMEDPFLADALEGFEKQPTSAVRDDINLLKDRLSERTENKKRGLAFPIYRVGIAAAVFLLAGSLSLIYFLNKSEERSRDIIVQQIPPVQPEKITLQDTVPLQANQPDATKDVIAAAPQMQAMKAPKPAKITVPEEKESFQATQRLQEPAPLTVSPSSPAMAYKKAIDTPRSREIGVAQPQAKARDVQEEKSKTADLEDVVVVGYGTQKKKSITGSVAVRQNDGIPVIAVSPYGIVEDTSVFRPLNSWSAFTAYFQKSVGQAKEWKNKHGEIIAGFTIDESGAAKDIRVEQSPDQALNRSTIRIINSGPKWTPGSGAERQVQISIKF